MVKKSAELDVVEDPEAPVKKEILSEAIVRISDSMKKLLSSGINERAIIVLIHDSIPVKHGYNAKQIGKRDIENVLHALKDLKARYCS